MRGLIDPRQKTDDDSEVFTDMFPEEGTGLRRAFAGDVFDEPLVLNWGMAHFIPDQHNQSLLILFVCSDATSKYHIDWHNISNTKDVYIIAMTTMIIDGI